MLEGRDQSVGLIRIRNHQAHWMLLSGEHSEFGFVIILSELNSPPLQLKFPITFPLPLSLLAARWHTKHQAVGWAARRLDSKSQQAVSTGSPKHGPILLAQVTSSRGHILSRKIESIDSVRPVLLCACSTELRWTRLASQAFHCKVATAVGQRQLLPHPAIFPTGPSPIGDQTAGD